MARVVLEGVTKNFGEVVAVDDVRIQVDHGEFLVLLGPSGCGKTTTLRCVAGLETVDEGRILIDDRDVTSLPPGKRGVSMVFQSYAVFPHMKVFENVAFGLRLRRRPSGEVRERVQRAADLLGIGNLLDRYPHQLSGGQKQRVAVARAIVVEPSVLLMDEPLSNIDALLRLRMRAELKLLQRELGATTIYVTHDQVEAMSVGDRIAVMNEGRLIQVDAPTRIYEDPVDTFVGGFIGTPPMNFLEGIVVAGDGPTMEVEGFRIPCPTPYRRALEEQADSRVLVGIRPESVEARNETRPYAMEARVLLAEALGSTNLLTVEIGDQRAKFTVRPGYETREDGKIWIVPERDRLRFMDPRTGKALLPE